ncbi:biotin transporter BioY [Desulfohalovibrio reitneri]|uniref:biotin transporter BioY n=1 Tax=Desulfohalovibrio reitneri TaxID=1307759 RepID=UPI0004A704D9|nr:biotin transporter BioY [Desulfohalovibrio reitneri]
MHDSMPLAGLHKMVWTALMAALVTAGAFMQLPLGPVPFTMQPFFAMLAGFVLGPLYGAAAVGLYVAAGLLGLPVFAGGKAGLAVLLGPTGGYLFGFILGAAVCGLAARGQMTWRRGLLFGLANLAVVYGLGLLQLKAVLSLDWLKALAVGFAPFILQDLVKLGMAVATTRFLRSKGLAPK